MNYKRIIACLFIIGSVVIISGFARLDDDPISKIAAQLDKWLTAHPQEKVYLQLDKPYYAIGDDIWFKAYITAGGNHRLSAISGVLNVELVDDKDSVKQRVKLPVVSGLTWGDFSLSDSLKEGNYRIRAYTNWMRNAVEDYFFDKTITITNSITNNVFTNTTYSYSRENGQQKVNAIISYTDLNGAPYANSQVSYEVKLGSKSIEKGKGQTDDKGNLNIGFVNLAGALKSGRIITELKIAGKKTVEKSVLIKAVSDNVDVQFFPEGGNLVNGNNTKIAFKAVGADGLRADIKGVVVDDQDKQVATFNSSHLGIGVFNLKPENGQIYKAKLTFADGSVNTVELPMASNAGYSLSIDNTGADNVIVKILPGSTVSASASETDVMSLIGQSGGVICYAGKSKPGSKFFTAEIPKNKFPSGIAQFTLFSSTGEPLNERLVFIQNHDELKLDAEPDKQVYSPRQMVKIGLNAKDKDGTPVVGSFSVAVTDETKVPLDEDADNSILSNLLLTSDLKGYVEKPNYYFINESDKTMSDLDALMLTQGYHRFEWKQVLSDSNPAAKYAPEKTLEISGHLKNLLGKPIANGKVTLFTTMGGIFMIDTVSDDKGNFTFKNLVFTDSVRFLIQGRTAKDRKNLQIDIDHITQQKVGGNKNFADFKVNITDGLSPFLQNSKTQYEGQLKYGLINHAVVLNEVEIKAKKNPAEHSANLNGPGNADQVIGSDDLVGLGCAQLGDCLQGKLLGVQFQKGVPYLIGGLRRPMEIEVDGVTVTVDVFNNINSNDIASIEVLKSINYTAIYGGKGGGGVLVVTTKMGGGNYSIQRYAPGIITYSPNGYTKVREFYSPQYDNPKTNAQIPDMRSTIYWKPNIITKKDGTGSFNYFNADTKGNYRVVIEGIDGNGDLGRLVFHYKVE
jgi:hypothetical protein